jgi:hypothetical protein
MNAISRSSSIPYLGEIKITTGLGVEDRLLWVMMEAKSDWLSILSSSVSVEMGECVGLLAVVLKTHALREEKHLFVQPRPRSE